MGPGRVRRPTVNDAYQQPVPFGAGIRDDLELLDQVGTTASLLGSVEDTGQDLDAFRRLRRHPMLERSATVFDNALGAHRIFAYLWLSALGSLAGRALGQGADVAAKVRVLDQFSELDPGVYLLSARILRELRK
jgi:hypothetical protein